MGGAIDSKLEAMGGADDNFVSVCKARDHAKGVELCRRPPKEENVNLKGGDSDAAHRLAPKRA